MLSTVSICFNHRRFPHLIQLQGPTNQAAEHVELLPSDPTSKVLTLVYYRDEGGALLENNRKVYWSRDGD